MAMYNVKVECTVSTGGMSRTECFETQVDEATYYKASTLGGRNELESWLKNFFPTAYRVQLDRMSKI